MGARGTDKGRRGETGSDEYEGQGREMGKKRGREGEEKFRPHGHL